MVEENYESACRLCLNSNSKNINVFENNSYAEIITTISASLSIQITQDDDFPKSLCTVCIEKVVSWDSFKKLCTESQEQLYQWRERKLQKQREEVNAISTISRLETSIHIKEEFIKDDFDDSFEYTYESFTPEFSIKFESKTDTTENNHHPKKSISPKRKTPTSSTPSSGRIPFNYQLVNEMYKDNICKFCSKKFNRNSNLVQHLRLFHMSIPMFTCFCCGISCKTKIEIQSHRILCKRKSLEKSTYSIEIQVNDNNLTDPLSISEKQIESTGADSSDYKFSCSLCGNLFKTIEEWTLHRATHVFKPNDADEKISEPITTEILDQSFSEILNDVRIENVRSECTEPEKNSIIPEELNFTEVPKSKRMKKSSKSKKKFTSRPKYNFKTKDNYIHNYVCECGQKFITIQGFSSHKKYHLRRGELFALKGAMKKNKDDVMVSNKKSDSVPSVIDDTFKCNGCDKEFSLASKFRFHKKRCPNLKEHFSIETTEKNDEISQLPVEEDVINENTEDNRDDTKCTFCKREYDNKQRCFKHEGTCTLRPTDLKTFLKIYPNAVKCGGCNKCYKSKSNFMKHRNRCSNAVLIDSKSQDDENLSSSSSALACFLCKRSFLSAAALTQHKKRCYFQRTSSCIECKRTFDSFINFRLHYAQSHDRKSLSHARRLKQMQMGQHNNHPINNTNTWSCKKCRKIFQSLKGYKYHMKTHGKHTCPNCHQFFYHSKHVKEHLEECQKIIPGYIQNTDQDSLDNSPSSSKSIGIASAPCAVCKMSFTTISELREHILVKHKPAFIQERKKKTYFCQFCKMAFDRHSDLKQHFNEYHAGNIKSEYPSPPVLKQEELQQNDNLICSLCQLSFDTQDELFEHENTMHNMEV